MMVLTLKHRPSPVEEQGLYQKMAVLLLLGQRLIFLFQDLNRAKVLVSDAFDRGEKGGALGEVGFHIAGQIYGRPDANTFCRTVDKTENNRNFRPMGDVIETGFPTLCVAAGAFRRNNQTELVGILELAD